MAHVEIGTGSELRQVGESKTCHSKNNLRPIGELHDINSLLFDAEMRSEKYRGVILSLFERSGIGLAILDPTLRVRSVNSALTSRCGRCPDDLRGRDFAEFLHPSVRQYVVGHFGRLVQGHGARLVSCSVAMCFPDIAVSGKLTAFPVEEEGAGRVDMIVVQFTPEETAGGQEALDGSEWRLAPLSAKVLEGVAAGNPSVRLAAKLFLSRQGIEYHVSMLLRQFKVPNRTALAAKAYSMGVFSIGSWPPRVLPDYIRAGHQGAELTWEEARAESGQP
ncbi:LuxR C-terminal-related transcriptional regulator [Streptomyces sp. NPDC058092]|uniref:LuxR C-terminal-related transcriptional regulator n=1 Tax=Streptomyces sp. NPDC058092 TaxID=3346336 RepID=UPI0036E98D22